MSRKPKFPELLSSCCIGQKLSLTLMLDTVILGRGWPLKTPLPAARTLKIGGGVTIRVDSTGNCLRAAQFSAAGVLFGHNGRVISTQNEIDEALLKVHDILTTVAHLPPIDEWVPWRVDMAWNFAGPARPLILAHASLLIPGIRKGGVLFPNCEGVSWRSARSRFMVAFYDKCEQMHVPGEVLRAEVRLCGPQLAKYFCDHEWHNFDALCNVFRRIMVSIPSIPAPSSSKTWQEALGRVAPHICDEFLAQFPQKSLRSLRRWRQRIQAGAANLGERFSWADRIPCGGLPERINVEPRNPATRRTRSTARTVSNGVRK